MVETEIKYKLTESQYKSLVLALGEPSYLCNQVDSYYKLPVQGVGMRFREDQLMGSTLTIKVHRGNLSAEELELPIDVKQKDILSGVFKVLGIQQDITVEKFRKVYKERSNISLSLDLVVNLGYFMEIEIMNSDAVAAQQQLNALVAKYGFRNLPKAKSYPQQVREKQSSL